MALDMQERSGIVFWPSLRVAGLLAVMAELEYAKALKQSTGHQQGCDQNRERRDSRREYNSASRKEPCCGGPWPIGWSEGWPGPEKEAVGETAITNRGKSREEPLEASEMTLLVGLRGVDGIVVASDSRGTFGDPRGVTAQNDAQKKLYIASKYSCVLTAGTGELGANIMAEALRVIQPNDGVSAVLDKTRTLVRQRYTEWFPGFALQPTQDGDPVRPDLALLVAGYDVTAGSQPEQKLFQLISQLDFAPMLHNYGFALVGVAQYALYLLNRLYQDQSTVERLKALAAYVITETASQDGKVGGPVQMAVITTTEAKELTPAEVEVIIKDNERKSNSLKDSFFKDEKKP